VLFDSYCAPQPWHLKSLRSLTHRLNQWSAAVLFSLTLVDPLVVEGRVRIHLYALSHLISTSAASDSSAGVTLAVDSLSYIDFMMGL